MNLPKVYQFVRPLAVAGIAEFNAAMGNGDFKAAADNISLVAAEYLYHEDWRQGQCSDANASAALAAELYDRRGTPLIDRKRRAELTGVVSGFLAKPDCKFYDQLVDLHDMIVSDVDTTINVGQREKLISIKWVAQAWANSLEAHYRSYYRQTGSQINTDIEPQPFAGPEAVLAYLSRYTHRVAIANSRLIACDEQGVTFKWKDYRARQRDRHKTMTLTTDEFIRRFLIHVLPTGLHRIRHYGLFANHTRVKQVQRLRELLSDDSIAPATDVVENNLPTATYTCRDCGAAMIIIETFEKHMPRAPPVYP